MSKDGAKKPKSSSEQAAQKSPSKPKGRSFCCSMFIYTFVFVSGVVVATILPDLAGHHFKQPYGKEYGAIAEQIFKDFPKHLTSLSETAVLLGRNLVDRVWDLRTQFEQRASDSNNKKDEKTKTKSSGQRSSARTHGTN